ncbi:porin [Melaminivora suipulveris]|uniref:Porin n=1 Tax=Melaminivora suipulveris TaxID=2109913 RepID=A0A2R3QEV3_9BURK|nr:porin [Melaminivora suipulveris]AVO50217.1 porin [Melaminivora suipulveris]
MKHRKLLALAVASVCATAAHAQSSVQLSGTSDVYVGSMKMSGDASRRTVVNSGGLTTSWFGFTGTEDLGGGLKAGFALTSFIQVDDGTQGRFKGDTFFSRDANVSLSGGFGTVRLGRWMAPNFLPSVLANPLGDSFTFSPLILHMNVPLFNGTGWGATTPSDTGWSNQIAYSTPDIGGFKANLQYQFGEQAGNNGKRNIGANFFYFGGPLLVTGFYERDQISNPGQGTYFGTTKTDWMLGAAYDFNVAKPYLTYGQAKADNVPGHAKTLQVGVSAPIGAGKVLASWARTNVSATDINRKTLTVGYDYNLSKRTDVYAMAMHDRITHQSSGTSFGVGIRHRF